jgi:hypothetical protein
MYARTPFLVQVNEAGQTGSKVELFISLTSTFPATATYTLEKNNPSSTNNVTRYNVTPFVREFISNTYQNIRTLTSPATLTPSGASAYIQIKRYKNVSGTYTLLDTRTYRSFDGYRAYTEGDLSGTLPFAPWNNEALTFNGAFPLFQYPTGMTFYYPQTSAASVPSGLLSPGYFTVFLALSAYVKYTSLANVALTQTTNIDAVNQRYVDIPYIWQSPSFPNTNYYAGGNLVEFYTSTNVLLYSFIFNPLAECRYTPVTIDFINKLGAWQRVFFFKASTNKITTTSEDYNFLTAVPTVNQWTVSDGQTRQMNRNARRKITVNSGSVDENFKFIIEQLMLSERIMVNNLPAKILTNDADLFKIVNKKDLNYTLDFEFAYDEVATVY